MKIVKHTFRTTEDGISLWHGEIEYKNNIHFADITYFPSTQKGEKGFYVGFLKDNDDFFDMPNIMFGDGKYKNACKYILGSIKKAIKGDHSKINIYGTCTSTPTDY